MILKPLPAIITFAQTDDLMEVCGSMRPVATESCSDRVFPIAEIDSQVRRQVPTDNLKAWITVIDDEEWLLVRRPCGGTASRRTHWCLPEILP